MPIVPLTGYVGEVLFWTNATKKVIIPADIQRIKDCFIKNKRYLNKHIEIFYQEFYIRIVFQASLEKYNRKNLFLTECGQVKQTGQQI